MNTTKILTLSVIAVFYWTCTNDSPLGISQHEIDAPDSSPTIPAADYTNGTDFSTGYYSGTIRSDRTQLEWTASTDNNFLCYKIFRAAGYEYEGGNLSYSLIETLNDKTTTTFMDTTLTQNQYYTYKIANIIDTGVPTVDDIAIKTPQWEPPSNIEYQILSPNTVQITWEDNSESEDNFKLYNGFSVKTVNKNVTTYTATGLNINVNYQYQIKATNAWEETNSGYGDYFTIEFNPPSYLSANQQGGTKLVNLTWYDNSSLEDGFNIERDTGSGFELLAMVSANTTSYTDTDTTDFEYGSAYTYRIRAYNDYSGAVYTDYSNEASVTISEATSCYFDESNNEYFYGDGDATYHYFYPPDVPNNCSATLNVTIYGDYASGAEYVTVYIDGTNYGSFGTLYSDCDGSDSNTFSITANDLQYYLSDNVILVRIQNSYDVGDFCGDGYYYGEQNLHSVQLIMGD